MLDANKLKGTDMFSRWLSANYGLSAQSESSAGVSEKGRLASVSCISRCI